MIVRPRVVGTRRASLRQIKPAPPRGHRQGPRHLRWVKVTDYDRAEHVTGLHKGVSMKSFLTAALGGAVLVAQAHAADVEAGHAIAQRWCANCHVTAEAQRGQDTAPPLATIAERHASDQTWLRAWLTSPHPPMPNLNLTRQEIDNVIAYLATLAPPHK